MALLLAAVTCFLSGFAVLALCRFPRKSLFDDVLLRVSLGAGFGLGLFSIVFYLSLVMPVGNLLVVDVAIFALLIAARAVQLRLRKGQPSGFTLRQAGLSSAGSPKGNENWPAWLQRTITASFVVAGAVAMYASIVRVIAFPHGNGWDAFAIWNLHARFLFLGGSHWRDGFTLLAGGSHPDYPLLLPAAIAHFWTILGTDDPRVPAVMAMTFTLATAASLFAALSTLRGRLYAMMGALALLATPFFVEHGADQYADVPLSFFYLATVILLCLFDQEDDSASAHRATGILVLAGMSAGFAAWTKNEGLLFLCAVVASRLLILARPGNDAANGSLQNRPALFHFAVPLLAGVLPGLLLVAYYKHSIGVPGDLFSDPATALPKLLTPKRYWVIFAGFVKGTFRFGHWLLIPGTALLAALYFAFGRDVRTRQPGFRTAVATLALTLAGYFCVFLITPYDIYWHLRFSLTRLFLQLWPSAIFLLILALRGRGDALRSGSTDLGTVSK